LYHMMSMLRSEDVHEIRKIRRDADAAITLCLFFFDTWFVGCCCPVEEMMSLPLSD